jgi:hypothetical protein
VVRENNSYKVIKTADALIPLIGVASALGDSSRYVWLKLPYCAEFSRVAKSTTLPIVMLGGESGETQKFLSDMKEGMHAHHNVRGTMIGRNVMYPASEDPVDVALLVQELVHNNGASKHAAGNYVENKQVADKQVADKQVADKQVKDKQVADKQVADKQVADKRVEANHAADKHVAGKF